MSARLVDPLPYVLLGTRQRAALEDVLSLRLTQWRERWSTSEARMSVQAPETAALGWGHVTSGGSLFAARSGHVTLVQIHFAAAFIPALLNIDPLAREQGHAPHAIADQLRSEALRALCLALVHGMGVPGIEFDDDASTHAARLSAARAQRALPVAVSMEGSGARWTIILHPSVVEFLLPQHKGRQHGAIDRRRNAIGAERIRVEALLGEAEISLAELASLAHGDVLVLDKGLAAAAHLVTELGASVADVALGTCDGRLAVRVTTEAVRASSAP